MQYILVLEDDKDLAQGIELSLEDENYRFIICYSIAQAKMEMSRRNMDLYILDVNLPDGNGLDVCKEIRKTCKTPIMLLTAKDMELDIVTGLEMGGDDYITKPFSLMVLRARVRSLLRRSTYDHNQYYKQGGFEFHFDTMEFYKHGVSIDLSKTEQRLLYLFVFHEALILTRERLLEWIWPEGSEYVEDNALSVCIRRLRDKLEDCPSKPTHIITMYGKGYLWKS